MKYDKIRTTKYYAIAGVSCQISGSNSDVIYIPNVVDCSTYSSLKDTIYNNIKARDWWNIINGGNIITENIILLLGDNVVNILSQIGWKGNVEEERPSKKIYFEDISIFADTDGGNTAIESLHIKLPHKEDCITKILEYLSS